MNNTGKLRMSWDFARRLVGIAFIALAAMSAAAQPTQNSTDAQREAMNKLAFLAGKWSGPVSIYRGAGEALRLTQHEDVEFKLDGLVLLIEGKSMGSDGKAQFEALATIAYDDASHRYRIRAYHDGHYLDAPLTVFADGFSWGFTSGPAKIENTMHLTAKHEWQETTEVTVGDRPAQRSVEMFLTHKP